MINLCFHGIGVCQIEREEGESRYWVSPDLYRRILDEVAGRDDIRLSFDDGNRSDIDVALPELLTRGLTADFFALAGRLDDPLSLSAADLRVLVDEGMTIGSHGWDHVPWRRLSGDQVIRELVDARTALSESAGRAVESAAFPLGRYDRAILRHLRRLGYGRVFTSDRFAVRDDAWLQARFSIRAGDTLESVRDILRSDRGPRSWRNRLVSQMKRVR